MNRNRTVFFIALLWLFTGSCTPAVNTTSGRTNSVLSTHRTAAVLPFEVVFANDVQQEKKFSPEEMKQLNQYFSLALQKHLVDAILSKQKKFPYSVTIQSADETNQLLASNKISFGAIFNGSKQDFCKLLNTDAVIVPQAVFGIKEGLQDISSEGKLQMHFSIFDSRSTTAVWTYSRTFNNNRSMLLPNSFLTIPLPQSVYSSNDKYEQLMLPWIQSIDKLFGYFTADCPYKKRTNF